MTLQERLNEVFPPPRERGLQARIAKACGVQSPSVSQWFNQPKKVEALELDHAEAICRAFDLKVSPRWLAKGDGPKLAEHAAAPKPAVIHIPAPIAFRDAIHALAFKLEGATERQRGTASLLLAGLAKDPATADEVANGLEAILTAEVKHGDD